MYNYVFNMAERGKKTNITQSCFKATVIFHSLYITHTPVGRHMHVVAPENDVVSIEEVVFRQLTDFKGRVKLFPPVGQLGEGGAGAGHAQFPVHFLQPLGPGPHLPDEGVALGVWGEEG